MKKLSEQIEDQSKPLVWLDSWDYCQTLFLKGEKLSWSDSAGFDGFIRKSDSLLQASITHLPLANFLDWVLTAMPNLKSAMAEKSRTGYALKTLLRNEELRKLLVQSLEIAGNAVPNKPLVLEVPSPRNLVSWAYEIAHGKAPDTLTVDNADSASVYLSDFVSSLGNTELSGLLVKESEWGEAEWKEESTIYTPLKNVSNYQQWSLGLQIPFVPIDEDTLSSFDFIVSPNVESSEDKKKGLWLDNSYWKTEQSELKSSFIFSIIPSDSVPEKVLENRKLLGGF